MLTKGEMTGIYIRSPSYSAPSILFSRRQTRAELSQECIFAIDHTVVIATTTPKPPHDLVSTFTLRLAFAKVAQYVHDGFRYVHDGFCDNLSGLILTFNASCKLQ
jgi:hypothetical protein